MIGEPVGKDDGGGEAFVSQVDPVVEAVSGRIDGVLRVSEREAREHGLLHVGLAVVIGVFEVPTRSAHR